MDTLPNPVFVKDSDTKFVLFNKAYETAFGMQRDQYLGCTVLDLAYVPPEARKALQAEDEEILQAGGTRHRQREVVLADGKTHTILYWVTRFELDDGSVGGLVGIEVDITEQKELERELAKANERMGKELTVGHEIQMSMLPLIFPAFPEHEDFDIFATLSPAREVGGDFYDFYFLDEDHICFTVGDVSGKGVPAALFMAVTKTLIKSRASSDFSPASIVTHVNDELSRDNDSCMFVTLYVAILDLRTGELLVSNAGHNPPLLKRSNGDIEWLKHRHGPVVGAMPGLAYGQDSVKLEPEDMVVLYTDGVTEADDGTGTLYGEDRLERALAAAREHAPENLVKALRESVLAFEGEEQADDITLLSVRYDGRGAEAAVPRLSLSLKNELAEIPRAITAFESWSEERQLPMAVTSPICMVLDELLNNVVSYAYDDDKGHTIELDVELVDGAVILTIIDDGIPFNPFTSKPPDTTAGIEDREIGGLGIHLVKEMMDDSSYQRRVEQNVVKITKLLASRKQSTDGETA